MSETRNQRNQALNTNSGQPKPLSGSKKVKQRNHSRQNHAGKM